MRGFRAFGAKGEWSRRSPSAPFSVALLLGLSRLMLDQGIAMGRGGVFLNLTEEQYEKLKR